MTISNHVPKRLVNNEVIGWRAWFVTCPKQTKLLCISSQDEDFDKLPTDGLIGFVLYEPTLRPDNLPTRLILSSYDYYFRAKGLNGYVYGCDVDVRQKNVMVEICRRYDEVSVIRGVWTDFATMKRVEKEMREAQTWP